MTDRVAVISEAMKRAAPHGEWVEMTRLLFDDPARFLNRLVAMLCNYWDEAFRIEWRRVRPTIDGSIELARTRTQETGVEGFFGVFKDQFRYDKERGVLRFGKPFERDVEISDRGSMTIVPSVYAWPHVLVAVSDNGPPVLIYPVDTLSAGAIP